MNGFCIGTTLDDPLTFAVPVGHWRSQSPWQHYHPRPTDSDRLVIVEALEDADFEVIEAEHAEAALAVLETEAARIHVLFTDIHMPGTMDGIALAHHTAKHWPKIALLLTSARPPPRQLSFPEKSRFLAKPYRHDRVIRHIRELAAAA
jgi:two-component system, response regulator PdtaR